MASYVMHLAIANLYLKEHKENEEEFIRGTIDVDDTSDKEKTHYSKKVETKNAKEDIESKVDLNAYVKENKIDNSYDRGYFLHLLADYYFYNYYFDPKIDKMEYNEFCEKLYNDYNVLNSYLMKKYNVIRPSRLNEKYFNDYEGKLEMMAFKTIDDFINIVSSLDIDNIYKMIIESKDISKFYKNV